MFDTPAEQKLETSRDHNRSKSQSELALCLTRAVSAVWKPLYLALLLFYVGWHKVSETCWSLMIGEHLCYWNSLGLAQCHHIEVQKYAAVPLPSGLLKSALSIAALQATFLEWNIHSCSCGLVNKPQIPLGKEWSCEAVKVTIYISAKTNKWEFLLRCALNMYDASESLSPCESQMTLWLFHESTVDCRLIQLVFVLIFLVYFFIDVLM